MGCCSGKLEESQRVVMRRDSYKCWQRYGCESGAVQRCLQMFCEGTPDKDGQLDHDGFCSIFALKRDEYTDRLVRIFDLDASGKISLREFVYGLSRFAGEQFELKVQFAYRLFDLDGDGSLDKRELTTALRAALSIDVTVYENVIRPSMAANGYVYDRPKVKEADEEKIKAVLEEIAGIKKALKYTEFQMLIARFPRLFVPANRLYDIMRQFSAAPMACINALSREHLEELLIALERQMDHSGSSFGDKRLKKGDKRVLSDAHLGMSLDQVKNGGPAVKQQQQQQQQQPPGGGSLKEKGAQGAQKGRERSSSLSALEPALPGTPAKQPPSSEGPRTPPGGGGGGGSSKLRKRSLDDDRGREERGGGRGGDDARGAGGGGGRVRFAESGAPTPWECPRCTLVNAHARGTCEACNAERPTGSAGAAQDRDRAGSSSQRSSSSSANAGGSGGVGGGSSSSGSSGGGSGGGRSGGASSSGSSSGGGSSERSGASSSGVGGGSGGGSKPSSSGRPKSSSGAGGSGRGGDEVASWLGEHGLGEYAEQFALHQVAKLEDARLLGDADLKEMGVPKGPRLRILDRLGGKAGGKGGGGAGPGGSKCRICMDAEVDTCLRPCNHVLLCSTCAASCDRCPICRTPIGETIRIFTA